MKFFEWFKNIFRANADYIDPVISDMIEHDLHVEATSLLEMTEKELAEIPPVKDINHEEILP
jgi:hypothetical protein